MFSPPFSHFAVVLLATFLSPFASASDGALDLGFGYAGRTVVPFDLGGNKTDQAFGTALQSDGRLVIVGSASIANATFPSNKDVAVTRLLADGWPDTSFGMQGKFTYNFNFPGFCNNEDVAHAVAIQADGKIVVVGTASCNSDNSNTSSLFVMRLMPNGTLDAGFGTGGFVLKGDATYAFGGNAVTLYGNDIVAAGFARYLNGQHQPYFVVLFGSGQEAAQEGAYIFDAGSAATGVSVDPLGTVTMSGYYKIAAAGIDHTNGFDCFIKRFTVDTSGGYIPDSGFGTSGTVNLPYDIGGSDGNDDYCHAHAVGSDGKIVIVGQAAKAGGGSYAIIDRLTASGQHDVTFNRAPFFFFEDQVNWINAFNVARAVAIRPDNRIVVAGYGHVNDVTRAPFDFGLVRFNVDGSVDQSFQGSEPGSRPGLAMIGFDGAAGGADDGAFAMVLDQANRIYAVGQHQYSGTDYNMAIARLQSDAIFVDGFDQP